MNLNNSNLLLTLLFSAIDNIVFISILSNFRNRNDYKIIDISLIVVMSIITTLFTLFGLAPYIKLLLIFILLFGATFFYDIKFHKKILAITIYFFILVISELLVTLIASNFLDLNLITIQSEYIYRFLGLFSKLFSILILTFITRNFLKNNILLPRPLNYMFIAILTLSITSMVLLFYSSLNLSSSNTVFMLFLVSLFTLFIILGAITMYYKANNYYYELQKETAKRI